MSIMIERRVHGSWSVPISGYGLVPCVHSHHMDWDAMRYYERSENRNYSHRWAAHAMIIGRRGLVVIQRSLVTTRDEEPPLVSCIGYIAFCKVKHLSFVDMTLSFDVPEVIMWLCKP